MVATMLHPMGADPSDHIAAFTEYAADHAWIVTHLGQFLGIALMFVGLVALSDSLSEEPIAWLARLGVYVAAAALAAAAVLQAVDGIALKLMVDNLAAASDEQKPSAFLAALAVRQIEVGMASFMPLLFGTAIALLGGAVAKSTAYPTWLGWLGLAGGVGTVVGGLLTAFTGFSMTAMSVAMPFALILVIWMVAIGFLMWRRS
jgi:hypothetical protein